MATRPAHVIITAVLCCAVLCCAVLCCAVCCALCGPLCSPRDVQEKWFAAQIDLAEELGRPLFMHCREATERFAKIYK